MATTSCSICTAALSFVESDVYAYGGIDTCAIIELDAQMFVCSWKNELLRGKFEPQAKYNSDTADLIYQLRFERWKARFLREEFRFSLILVDVNLAVSQRFRWSLIPEAPKFMKHLAIESETFSQKTRFIANEVSCLDTRLSSIYRRVFSKKSSVNVISWRRAT